MDAPLLELRVVLPVVFNGSAARVGIPGNLMGHILTGRRAGLDMSRGGTCGGSGTHGLYNLYVGLCHRDGDHTHGSGHHDTRIGWRGRGMARASGGAWL